MSTIQLSIYHRLTQRFLNFPRLFHFYHHIMLHGYQLYWHASLSRFFQIHNLRIHLSIHFNILLLAKIVQNWQFCIDKLLYILPIFKCALPWILRKKDTEFFSVIKLICGMRHMERPILTVPTGIATNIFTKHSNVSRNRKGLIKMDTFGSVIIYKCMHPRDH